ncbi:MAG: CpsD/CapB family tyrosine-protein kinase [Acidobacteriota bacterium]|nr:MAG: CpsD/CapB family tyrosine-protein kinase [Acidobacteriota bacterium]
MGKETATKERPRAEQTEVLKSGEKRIGNRNGPDGRIKLTLPEELAIFEEGRGPVVESFRRLKTKLLNCRQEPPQVIIITSPVASDGKSFVAMNLAQTFSHDPDGRTLLIDADLRRPTLDQWLDPPPEQGLAEVLNGELEPEKGICKLEGSALRVLPAGQPTDDPLTGFGSQRCSEVFKKLRHWYRRIIVDCPPILPVVDADLLSAQADGVLLVVRSENTPRAGVTRALSSFNKEALLGVVFNGTRRSIADWLRQPSGRYYHYYRSK